MTKYYYRLKKKLSDDHLENRINKTFFAREFHKKSLFNLSSNFSIWNSFPLLPIVITIIKSKIIRSMVRMTIIRFVQSRSVTSINVHSSIVNLQKDFVWATLYTRYCKPFSIVFAVSYFIGESSARETDNYDVHFFINLNLLGHLEGKFYWKYAIFH